MSKNPNNQYVEFIGKVVGSDISEDELCARLHPLKAQIMPPNVFGTMDYNPTRVRVWLKAGNVIESINVG